MIENHALWIRWKFVIVSKIWFEFDNFKILQELYNNIIASTVFDSEDFENISEKSLVFFLKLENLQIDEGKIGISYFIGELLKILI